METRTIIMDGRRSPMFFAGGTPIAVLRRRWGLASRLRPRVVGAESARRPGADASKRPGCARKRTLVRGIGHGYHGLSPFAVASG